MNALATRRFLVTGCARSGTGYAARLFTALGAPCGHEAVFRPSALQRSELAWPDGAGGESSWLAAPLLARLPADLPVVHQVRHPLAVVRSKLRTRFFERPSWYKSFAEDALPELLGLPLAERALTYWVRWNRLVERGLGERPRPWRRVRVEDLGVESARDLCALLGREPALAQVRRALEELPRDENTRGDRSADELRAWDDLPPAPIVDEARALALRYGYDDAA